MMLDSPWPDGLCMTNARDTDQDSLSSSHAHQAVRVHKMRPRVYSLACSDLMTPPSSRRDSISGRLPRSDGMYFADFAALQSVQKGNEDTLALIQGRLSRATLVLDEIKQLLESMTQERAVETQGLASRQKRASVTADGEKTRPKRTRSLIKYCQERFGRQSKDDFHPDPMSTDNSVNFDEATIVIFPQREPRPLRRLSLGLKRAVTTRKRRQDSIE